MSDIFQTLLPLLTLLEAVSHKWAPGSPPLDYIHVPKPEFPGYCRPFGRGVVFFLFFFTATIWISCSFSFLPYAVYCGLEAECTSLWVWIDTPRAAQPTHAPKCTEIRAFCRKPFPSFLGPGKLGLIHWLVLTQRLFSHSDRFKALYSMDVEMVYPHCGPAHSCIECSIYCFEWGYVLL